MAKRWSKSQNGTGSSHKASARLGSSGLSLLGAPGKWGKKKETFSCPTYMLSGIALAWFARRLCQPLDHDCVSLATRGTKACDAAGDAFRPQCREWPAPGI